MSHQDLKRSVSKDMPRLRGMLEDLVRIPSISAPGHDRSEVRRAAEHIAGLLREAGFAHTQLLDTDEGNPAVFAEIEAPEGAPTLLLYAHYDVQPPGPIEDWETGPFEPFEKDGRLYGRGVSDDKAGVIMHLGAVAAHGENLPVGVQVFFEGEEEAGSESLEQILETHSDLLHPDVIVIGDGGNWAVGVPSFLTSLRGLAAVSFELRTLDAPVHSGQYGGVFPDAITAMAHLLASLHDDEGNVAIPGLVSEEVEGLDVSPELARQLAGAIDGLREIGSGSIPVAALDAAFDLSTGPRRSPVNGAINQLVPVARAKVSMRIAPGENAAEALGKLKSHLIENAPWGAKIDFLNEEKGDASTLDTDNFAVQAWSGAFAEAYGQEPVHMGAGGSIPFIATFAELFPDAPILVIGCGDPTSAIHAPNESQDLGDLEKATLAEAIAFSLLAG